MWLMLVGLIVIALVACLLLREVRRAIGYTALALVALVGLAVAADLARSLREISRENQAMERIQPREVRLDDLELTGSGRENYRLTGLLHNASPNYTLTDVRFRLIVEDCVKGACREQARGYAEVIRRVPPNQAAMFDTSIVTLPTMASPRGERRLTCQVFLTTGRP